MKPCLTTKLMSKRHLKRDQTVGQKGHKQVDGFSPESGKNGQQNE